MPLTYLKWPWKMIGWDVDRAKYEYEDKQQELTIKITFKKNEGSNWILKFAKRDFRKLTEQVNMRDEIGRMIAEKMRVIIKSRTEETERIIKETNQEEHYEWKYLKLFIRLKVEFDKSQQEIVLEMGQNRTILKEQEMKIKDIDIDVSPEKPIIESKLSEIIIQYRFLQTIPPESKEKWIRVEQELEEAIKTQQTNSHFEIIVQGKLKFERVAKINELIGIMLSPLTATYEKKKQNIEVRDCGEGIYSIYFPCLFEKNEENKFDPKNIIVTIQLLFWYINNIDTIKQDQEENPTLGQTIQSWRKILLKIAEEDRNLMIWVYAITIQNMENLYAYLEV